MTPDEALERTQWDFYWVPDHATVVDRPDLAYIASEQPVAYLNTAVRVRGDLDAHLAEVRGAHTGTSRVMVAGDRPELEAALTRHGYAPANVHAAYAIAPGAYTPRRTRFRVREVRDLQTLGDCVGVLDRAFGSTRTRSPEELGEDLAGCTRADGRTRRFVVYDGDQPVSSGGLNVYPDLSFGFLWAGGTIPEARGRGAYSALLTARIQLAQRLGLAYVGLYARVRTSAPVVEAQGFTRYGPMVYWDA